MLPIRCVVASFAVLVSCLAASAQDESLAMKQKRASLAAEEPAMSEGVRGNPQDACPGESVFTCAGFIFAHTNSATTVGSDPQFACAFGGPRQGVGTVWARLVPVTSSITIRTSFPNPTLPNGRLPDTLLAVYTGACGALTQIACNDDIDFDNGNLLSSITLNGLTVGQTYFIEVAAYSGLDVATYTLALEGCLLPNWICEGAETIGCEQVVSADIRRSSTYVNSPLFPCRVNGPTRGFQPLWYRFIATARTTRLFTSDGNTGDSADDTLLAVYSGPCEMLTQIGCDDDSGPGFFSEIVLNKLTVGQPYYVEIAGYDESESGVYLLHMECSCDSVCPPGAHVEAEPCGTDTNSGCWNNSPGVEPVGLGQVICGRSADIGGMRGIGNDDYDIYGVSLTRVAMLYWVVQSDIFQENGSTAILTDGCQGTLVFINSITARPCESSIVSAFLPAGDYQGGIALSQLPCPSIGGRYLACATIGPGCRGDADGDGEVDFADITAVLETFTFDYRPFPGIGPGDANFSGDVGFADITAVLENFNTACSHSPMRANEVPAGSPWAIEKGP